MEIYKRLNKFKHKIRKNDSSSNDEDSKKDE